MVSTSAKTLCQELLEKIVAHATSQANFVRVDMEGSAYTQRTVEMVKRVRAKYAGVGTVMQAYLYRAEQDVQDLLAAGCRMRLCKGAYKEPPEVAFPEKADVDANYVKLMKVLLGQRDLSRHRDARPGDDSRRPKISCASKISSTTSLNFRCSTEFAPTCRSNSYATATVCASTFPFGTDWFPYFMRRLAERPANVAFFLRNLLPRSQSKPSAQ